MALMLEAPNQNTESMFDRLAREYGQPVYRYVYGMLGDPEAAEDLTQDIFLKVFRALPQLKDTSRARSWIFSIAANTTRDYLRNRGKPEPLPLDELETHPSRLRWQPEADMVTAIAVRDALASLRVDDRNILLLVGHLGMIAKEAAEVLQISSMSAAQKRWQRACDRFREAMGDSI
jgi:RNA polymerase sigma-70 factor (ECF subfamily)